MSAMKGDVFFYQDNYSEAIKYYDKALEINPKYNFALSEKGRLLFVKGNISEAVELFDKALQSEPNNPVALNNLA